MSEGPATFVQEHPFLALTGVAILTAAIDVTVTYGMTGTVQPLMTGLFVLLITGAYAALLVRNGTLQFP